MNELISFMTKDGRRIPLQEKPGMDGGALRALAIIGVFCAACWSLLSYWLWPFVGPWILRFMR